MFTHLVINTKFRVNLYFKIIEYYLVDNIF
jgi:hypothetical protein